MKSINIRKIMHGQCHKILHSNIKSMNNKYWSWIKHYLFLNFEIIDNSVASLMNGRCAPVGIVTTLIASIICVKKDGCCTIDRSRVGPVFAVSHLTMFWLYIAYIYLVSNNMNTYVIYIFYTNILSVTKYKSL